MLTSWNLRKYKDAKGADLDLVAAASKETGVYPFALLDEPPDAALSAIAASPVNVALYRTSGIAWTSRTAKKGSSSSNTPTASPWK